MTGAHVRRRLRYVKENTIERSKAIDKAASIDIVVVINLRFVDARF